MVFSFGIICALLAINFIVFWGAAPCNFVDYMSDVGKYVIGTACNYEIYFDLCAFP
jgi:hypothetical protein